MSAENVKENSIIFEVLGREKKCIAYTIMVLIKIIFKIVWLEIFIYMVHSFIGNFTQILLSLIKIFFKIHCYIF